MAQTKLAINGGQPVRNVPFVRQICINEQYLPSVLDILRSGKWSGYRANKDQYLGGPEIKKLCHEWSEHFGVEYVIPVNSCTSGLMACLSVLEKNLIDVTPYSMSCSASLPYLVSDVVWNDIDEDYFQMDDNDSGADVAVPVSLFGHPLTWKYNADIVIEDSAQCVSKQIYKTDFRVHSLTEGKHITCGEGGVITTDNKELARMVQNVINHEESVAHDFGLTSSGIGLNLRLTEIQASLVRSQLSLLGKNIEIRQQNVSYLNDRLRQIPGIRPAKAYSEGIHSYYCAPFHYTRSDVPRDAFLAAVRAELHNVRLNAGYIKPLYRFPCFSDKQNKLRLPIVERMWKDELFLLLDIAHPHTLEDMEDIANSFEKVADNVRELYWENIYK